jgi:glycosyltransferase involved in cell wall biosynthesis
MKKTLPLVSIVLPAYNHGKYLHEAIQSVLSQSYPNVELLVFDDGSTDNTAEILATYDKQFYWERHKNMGQSATLNKGWQMSTGEIISYLSADDALEPNAVEMAVKCLQNDNDAMLAYGDYLLVDAESKVIERVYAPEFDYSEMVANIVVQPGPGVFFRRYAFEKIGGWNESLCQIPDYEYWLRLGILGHFTRIPKSLARYRVHEESQSYIEPTIEKSEECVHVMHEFFENENISTEIKVLEPKAKSMAHLIAARFHLRAGRYKGVVRSLEKAWNWRARSILSIRMIRLLGNGLLFRMKRLMLQK